MRKKVFVGHSTYKAPSQQDFDDSCFFLPGEVPDVQLTPDVVAARIVVADPIVLIRFQTTGPMTVHARNFRHDETVGAVIDYVASQIGVEPHRFQLQTEPERGGGVWFLPARQETMADIGHYVRCILRDWPLGIPVYQVRVLLTNPDVGDADNGAPQHGVGVGGVGR